MDWPSGAGDEMATEMISGFEESRGLGFMLALELYVNHFKQRRVNIQSENLDYD